MILNKWQKRTLFGVSLGISIFILILGWIQGDPSEVFNAGGYL